ncbi:UNVERIFIED_CONTAM: hypothetical protein K2H54_047522 [Gekko kuhli]
MEGRLTLDSSGDLFSELAWEYGIPFFETSAKNNINIEHAFSVLAQEILDKVGFWENSLYYIDMSGLEEGKYMSQERGFLDMWIY